VGRHSTVKPETPAPQPKPTITEAPTITADGKEVYGKPAVTASLPAAAPATATPAAPAKPEVKEEDLNDPADATIAVGASCKRKGCKSSYEGAESRDAACTFHSGVPIFHEGSKVTSFVYVL
jgi:hypothetical protein